MSISSDQSIFTSCVLKEAGSADLGAFNELLAEDPLLQAEAKSIAQTADSLAAAFDRETLPSLTLPQRHGLLNYGMQPAAMPPRPGSRKVRWITPVLATAGVAAALAMGLWLLPEMKSSTPQNTNTVGVPAITIQPSSTGRTGTKPPAALPPGLVANPQVSPVVPVPGVPPAIVPHPFPKSMAAVPPEINLPSAGMPAPVPSPGTAASPPPEKAADKPRKGHPGENLASPPQPRKDP